MTSAIKSIIPDARLRHSYGAELSFELSPKQVAVFGQYFRRLEAVDRSIGIESFGIELPNLEDVFLK